MTSQPTGHAPWYKNAKKKKEGLVKKSCKCDRRKIWTTRILILSYNDGKSKRPAPNFLV
jgi:hypothetical protein